MQAKATITTYQNETIQQETVICDVAADTGAQERDVINLYPDVLNQTILSFGGAITEAVGSTLAQMPARTQTKILRDVFGADGLRYTQVRTSIDSCDFSLAPYEAASASGVPLDLSHDDANIIPFIHAAQAVCPAPIGVMLTPWSPPAYMKDNHDRNHGGRLKPEYYAEWADYICRYILAYQACGLNVTRLSVQNEPNATQLWDSCLFTGAEEQRFLRDFLKPALLRHKLEQVAVYIWDHNKERLFDRVREVLDDSTQTIVNGAAFHWYSGDHFEALALVRRFYPNLDLMFSEGCIEFSRYCSESQLQNARLYAHDMIGNFNAGMNTFFDWNIALGRDGGPNHAQNFCEAPILCDTEQGTFEKRLSYYYIGHFSRFIEPGARHIASTVCSAQVRAAAFQNPDGRVVAVLLNSTPAPQRLYLRLLGRVVAVSLPGDSIGTVELAL